MIISVEAIARICHEANRQYCRAISDDSQLPWDEAPDWQRDSALQGVAAIITGIVNHPSESHSSWMRQKVSEGWIYGPKKDVEKKEHPCMLPYLELPLIQRLKDTLFFNIVKALT